MLSPQTPIKLYETRTIVKQENFTGTDLSAFYVHAGSRMLITLLVTAIDSGATVNLFIDNNFDTDEADDTILTMSATSVARVKRVLSDFHNQFTFRTVVSGGNASFKIGVSLFDNAMTTRIDNAIVEVDLHHTTDVNGMFDSVRIGDGTDLLAINSDGSINTVAGEAPDEEAINVFQEAVGVANSAETTILTYSVPSGRTAFLSRIDVGGENIARYEVYIDSDLIARKRTYWGNGLGESFDFSLSSRRGLQVEPGEIITVKVIHERPFSGTFEARLQGLLKG